jgi:hypothetical protein
MVCCGSVSYPYSNLAATRLGLAKIILSSLLDIPLRIMRPRVEKRRDEIL